jgi:hypothetical protein
MQPNEGSSHNLQMVNVNVSRPNVLNRVTNQQDKWKKQVNFLTHFLTKFFHLLYTFLGSRTTVKNL